MSCSSWGEVTFNSLYAEPSRNGLYKPKEFHGRGTRIVNMGELFGYEWIGAQEMQRVELTDAEVEKFGLLPGDLLFGRRSLVESGAGKCSLVTASDGNLAFESSIIRVRLDNAKAHPRYFYYYFLSHQGRAKIAAIVGGANVKGIRGSDLEKINVALPPLDIQEACATQVCYFDDLISNTQERIQLLEEAVRLIYTEWFVRQQMPQAVISSVTEKSVDGFVSDFVNILSGGTPNTKLAMYWEGDIPFFTPADAPAACYVVNTEKHLSEAGLTSCNSALFSKDTVFVTARGTVGKLALAQKPMAMNQSCYALQTKDGSSQFFLYCAMQAIVAHLKQAASGGVFDAIIVDTFRRTPMIWPPREVIDRFHAVVEPIFTQIETLLLQIEQLRQARDLLLPRLISGQLRL